jgi:hypothetical protein
MVIKKLPASEGNSLAVDIHNLQHILPMIQKKHFEKLDAVPGELLLEMETFTERNALAIIANKVKDRTPLYRCCVNCLKAYAVNIVKKFEMGGDVEDVISKVLECESGHDGYYIDEGKLIKI